MTALSQIIRGRFGEPSSAAIIQNAIGSTRIENTIHELAELAGVLVEWVDVWGQPQTVRDDHLLATLRALTGRDLESARAISDLAGELRNDRPLVEPVVVAWDGWFPGTTLGHPVSSAHLVTEQDGEVPVTIDDRRLTIEQQLPLGYHHLHVSGTDRTTLVIAAPQLAAGGPERAFGVVAPVYSLRTDNGDTGVGNFGLFGQLADTALVTGTEVIGTLPLVATFPDQPSPYAPASRRAWNELFIDLAAAPGWHGEITVHEGDPLWVDYEGAAATIRESLARYAAFAMRQPQLRRRIDRFAAAHPEAVRYAGFRATGDRYGRDWRSWPSDATGDDDREAYHLVGQWLATEQLENLSDRLTARGQYLYLDLPIGCHPDGYDIWDQQAMFAPASVGAPPDSLFLGGQEWGLPATIPQRSREAHHVGFIKAVRHQLSVAGLLRVDHVMGLHRAWWVPHGLAATEGAYVMQPTLEMFAIVCIESHRADAAVIGENLGTVPEAVNAQLSQHRLLGMKVAIDALEDPADNELMALATHDTPPFAAWWKEDDIDDGEDLGVYRDGRGDEARHDRQRTLTYLQGLFGTSGMEETRDAILAWMARSEAAVTVVNVDDLWGEERRQNVPGTDTERPNWRARHALSLEELASSTDLISRLEHLHALRNPTHDGSARRAR
jgi:4-alpha-glucanotransferase